MALKSFGLKVLVIVAGMGLLSACETAVDTTQKGGTSGGTTQTTTTTKTEVTPSKQVGPIPGTQEDLVLNVGDRIFFDFDKSDIRDDQQAQVERWAAWLKKFPSVTVTIEGHCDERGTREYNLGLGDRRSNSAKRALEALGISGDRIGVISFGKERPVCEASNEGCWAQNRRAVMVVN